MNTDRNLDYTLTTHATNALQLSTHFLLAITLAACGPSLADGGETFGDTDTSGDGGVDDGAPEIIGEPVCVEMVPGQVTCWVGWLAVHALVKLPCQVSGLVSSGAWGPGIETDLGAWGLTMCYPGALGETCIHPAGSVELTEVNGVWSPTLSAEVELFDPVGAPCGGCTSMAEGCECGPVGECALGLQCSGGVCEGCPAGSPGCFCYADETCDAGLVCNTFVCE